MDSVIEFITANYPVIVTVLSTLAGAGIIEKFAPDKWLKIFIKSGDVAQKYADLVDKVEGDLDV